MIGRNSNYIKVTINGKIVAIQANKNFAICDLVFIHDRKVPQRPTEFTKEAAALYKKEKLSYDMFVSELKVKKQAFLNKFQGKQINDSYVVERAINFLQNETQI